MKRFFLAFLLVVCVQYVSAIVPAVDYVPDWYTIDEIKTGKDATIVDVTFFHYPGSWISLSSNTLLRDPATNTEYKLVKAEGIGLNEQVVMDKSGHRKAKLYFEPLPKNVKSVNLIEVGTKDHKQSYGIHLNRKRQNIRPISNLTAEDIYNRQGDSGTWTPPIGKRLQDERFAVPGGSVHLTGKIDNYVPEIGNTVVLIGSHNELTRNNCSVSAQLDSVGNFVADIPVEHVQKINIKLGDFFFQTLFVFPGDTVSYHATTKRMLEVNQNGDIKRSDNYEYKYVDSDNPATVEINTLRAVLSDSISDLQLGFSAAYDVSQQGYDSVMVFGEKVKDLTREAVTRLNKLLTPLNISPEAKDVLFTDLLVEVNVPMHEAAMYYESNKFLRKIDENGKATIEMDSDYVHLDVEKFYGGQEDYIAYLWDNPYVVRDWVFINRMEFRPPKCILKPLALEAGVNFVSSDLSVINVDEELHANKSRYGWFQKFMEEQERDYGIGNDFLSQLIITKAILSKINQAEANSASLERVSALGADVMRMVNYLALQEYYHKALNDLAMKVAVNESGKMFDEPSQTIETQSEILASIVAPYKGRVVYVDVWDAYCGPCRAGMINQKDILEKFKYDPLTVVYLAPESNREVCEKFLRENDIKGEHIFLSNDDDARFKADFDIQSIPFGILIKKNGEFTTDIACNLDFVFEQALAE